MLETTCLLFFAVFCFGYLLWGARVLPREHWQILASLPGRRSADGVFKGVNLTWYGFFTANATLIAVVTFLILTASARLPLVAMLLFISVLLAICIPASRLVARLVEKKAHTFTVGGAVFVGVIVAPWVLVLLNQFGTDAEAGLVLSYEPALAALAVAYAFGEGLGRLACISFGCCYGKPVETCSPGLQKVFGGWAVQYSGATKKIAYASGLEGVRVIPIQALTAMLYVTVGLVGMVLFLSGKFLLAFFLNLIVTHLWRVMSEWLRADFRGSGALTAYQWMGLAAIPYSVLVTWLLPSSLPVVPTLQIGLQSLWQPELLVAIQTLWLTIFLLTGRSEVTGATLNFHVYPERV